MKVPKMLVQYTLMFTVPTAVALYYWDPKSDADIRQAVVRHSLILASAAVRSLVGAAPSTSSGSCLSVSACMTLCV